jgi:two-component system, cell cycle response regulator
VKILVADDDPSSRLIARMALELLGHECDIVTDGTHAWNAFQTGHHDVVLSDWLMPGQTGLELCQNIRADPKGAQTYVILLTGQGAQAQILEGMNAGADDYLVKPLHPDELEMRLIAAHRVTSLHHQLAGQRTQLESLNHELSVLARRDPLTGLNNRRVLDEDLDVIEARVARYSQRYCIALLDIDHFKAYNDSYGHQAGDHVLQLVSTQLEHQARAGDALYRYGGEEFLCIFPEQVLAGAVNAAQRMRASVQQLDLPHVGNDAGVITLSAGVATLDPDTTRSAREVLKEADDALYQAKQRGRNRVEIVNTDITDAPAVLRIVTESPTVGV